MPSKIEDMLVGERWPSVVHAPAINNAAIATKAAVATKRHVVTGVTISSSAAPAAAVEVTLEINGGMVERIKLPAAVFPPIVINFDPPYVGDGNTKAELTIPNVGAAVAAAAVLRGFSIPA